MSDNLGLRIKTCKGKTIGILRSRGIVESINLVKKTPGLPDEEIPLEFNRQIINPTKKRSKKKDLLNS